jgi:hypothetical protein
MGISENFRFLVPLLELFVKCPLKLNGYLGAIFLCIFVLIENKKTLKISIRINEFCLKDFLK